MGVDIVSVFNSPPEEFNMDSLLITLTKRREELSSQPISFTDYDNIYLEGAIGELGYVIDLICSRNNINL